jgi:hypothetical protein
MNKIKGSEDDAVKQQFRSRSSKHTGTAFMCTTGGRLVNSEDLNDLSVSDIVCYKYVILVSWDVECTFSQRKSLYRDNRQRPKLTKLRGLSPQANYTDRATAAVGEVVPTFAGRGCYVVSATDSHGR